MRIKLYAASAALALLLVAGAVWAYNARLAGTMDTARTSCCPNGPCCSDGPCCGLARTEAKTAQQDTCCFPGSPCCVLGLECCEDGTCCPDGDCCLDGPCCPDGPCCGVAATQAKVKGCCAKQ